MYFEEGWVWEGGRGRVFGACGAGLGVEGFAGGGGGGGCGADYEGEVGG